MILWGWEEGVGQGVGGQGVYLLKCKVSLAIKKKKKRQSTAGALCSKIVLFCDGAV